MSDTKSGSAIPFFHNLLALCRDVPFGNGYAEPAERLYGQRKPPYVFSKLTWIIDTEDGDRCLLHSAENPVKHSLRAKEYSQQRGL
jgi:hypothetical protein